MVASAKGLHAPRLLLYCVNYAPELLGVGRYAGELGAYLASQGVELEVVTTPPHYPGWRILRPYRNRYTLETHDRVRVTRCPIFLREEMSGLARLLVAVSFAVSTAPVVVWRAVLQRPQTLLATEPSLSSAPAALLAARLSGARAVLHVQDLEVEAAFAVGHLKGGLALSLARSMERFLLKRFDLVVTISEQMQAALQDGGVKPERLRLLRNWVDLTSIYPKPGPNPVREEIGAKDDERIVLYSGNIGRKQALEEVLAAAAITVDDRRLRFVIAGEGPEKARLQATAPSNVTFLPLQPEARLNDLLNAADVHVLPQNANAADLVLPSKLGGMLASGKPIVAQAAPGTELHTFLASSVSLTRPGDAGELVDGIMSALNAASETAAGRAALARQLSAADVLPRFSEILLT